MTVGMPGSGISALFYACLVAWMPVRETWRALRGGPDRPRWRHAAFHWAILGAILGVLWFEAALIDWAIGAARDLPVFARSLGSVDRGQGFFLRVGQFAAFGSLFTLAAIFTLGAAARIALAPGPDGRAQAPAAP